MLISASIYVHEECKAQATRMRLACEARALHVPRETPSSPRTLDSSFSLKDSSTYTIYPIVLLLDSLSTSLPYRGRRLIIFGRFIAKLLFKVLY